MYFNDGGVMRLVGAMYVMPEAGVPGPRPGGALTTWHAHPDLCFEDRVNGPFATNMDPAILRSQVQ